MWGKASWLVAATAEEKMAAIRVPDKLLKSRFSFSLAEKGWIERTYVLYSEANPKRV